MSSTKKYGKLSNMTHDQFQHYLKENFGEETRSIIIDLLGITSPRFLVNMDVEAYVLQCVKSMQFELKKKLVQEIGDSFVVKHAIVYILNSFQKDMSADGTQHKKRKRDGQDTSSATDNERNQSESDNCRAKRARLTPNNSISRIKYRQLPDSWRLKAAGDASSFDDDEQENLTNMFIDASDDVYVRQAQLSLHHYVMQRLVHHFFKKYLSIDRKEIAQFSYDLQIRLAYTMEYIVEFCGYIRSNEHILHQFSSVPGEATIEDKLDYVCHFMKSIQWVPTGFVKHNSSSIRRTTTTTTNINRNKQEAYTTTNALVNVD